MSDAFATGLIYPALGLALLGWLVPRLLSMVFPEGVKPLLILGAISAIIMYVLSVVMFVLLYTLQGVPMAEVFQNGGAEHLLWLGVLSALLWGPILLLSVAALPRSWVEEEW